MLWNIETDFNKENIQDLLVNKNLIFVSDGMKIQDFSKSKHTVVWENKT